MLCKEVTKNNKESHQVVRILSSAHFEVNFGYHQRSVKELAGERALWPSLV